MDKRKAISEEGRKADDSAESAKLRQRRHFASSSEVNGGDGWTACAVSGAAPARIHLRIYLARLGSIAAAKERAEAAAAAMWRAARCGGVD